MLLSMLSAKSDRPRMIQNVQFLAVATKVILRFFQSFPTKVVQNYSKYSIFAILHILQYFSTKVVQNNSECLILIILHFFPSFPTKVV